MNTEVAFDQQEFLSLGIERSQKFHILKFRSVMGRLMQFQDEGFFTSNHENFLSVVSAIKSAELLEYGSDFFWSSMHRVFNAFDAGNEMTEIMYGIFLQNAFDSFFQLLPIGSRLEFKNYGDDHIIFIRIGVSIEKFLDWPVILEKTGEKSLAYGYANNNDYLGSQMVTIGLEAISNYHGIKMDIIAGAIKVLYQRHQVLFEHVYHYECNDSVYLGKLFYPRLLQAFAIIKDADELLYRQITENLDYIVPLAKPGKGNHPSFASALLKRTIFLSLDLLQTSDYYLAECIIHEFGHCQLYKVQDTILLTKVDLDKRYYYSPWRTDPRHLLGLVHGVYVFNCVIKFYRQLLNTPALDGGVKLWVQDRVILLVGQVLCATRQVREDEIATAGELLLNDISEGIKEIAVEMQIDLNALHPEISVHQNDWKLKNTDPEFVIR